MDKKGKTRKALTGWVCSNAPDKTAIVLVERLIKHPLYKKYVKKRKKFYAHDERNDCQVGDKVMIIESRPYSKMKRWKVVKVLERAE